MWVEIVVGSLLCSEGFSPGSPVFFPPQNPLQISIENLRENHGYGWCRFLLKYCEVICFLFYCEWRKVKTGFEWHTTFDGEPSFANIKPPTVCVFFVKERSTKSVNKRNHSKWRFRLIESGHLQSKTIWRIHALFLTKQSLHTSQVAHLRKDF